MGKIPGECPHCGERRRLKVVCKWMRRPDYRDNVPAAYVRCMSCNARGPIASGGDPSDVDSVAVDMWNGSLKRPVQVEGFSLSSE